MSTAILDIPDGPPAVREALPDKGEPGRDRCRCPACGGPASVEWSREHRGKVMVTCWAGGCTRPAIVEASRAMGLESAIERPAGPFPSARHQRTRDPSKAAHGRSSWAGEGDSHGPNAQQHGRSAANRPTLREQRRTEPQPDAEAKRQAAIADLWDKARRDAGPIAAYLAGRGVWPPDRPLPPSIRALPIEAIRALRWREEPPPDTALVMACAYRQSRRGPVLALSFEALTAEGCRTTPRWRRTIGTRRGAAFHVPGDPAGELHLAEGEADAIAIAFWRGREAWATGGTGGMDALALGLAATGREIVIEADGGREGRKAAERVEKSLQARGCKVRVIEWPKGSDPADGLADAWAERAAIREFNADIPRPIAESEAWREEMA